MDNKKVDYDDVQELVELVQKGRVVPCPFCSKALVMYYAPSNEVIGVRCPDGHDEWPIISVNMGLNYDD